jgi:hypothetical protein
MRLDGSERRDPPAWSGRFREAAIIGAGRDDGVDDAGHLGGHGGVRLPSSIRIGWIGTDVGVKLPVKTILPHADGHGPRPPEGVAQPRIATFGQVGRAPILPGLIRAEIEPAIFQELPHAAEATEVPRFSEDDQGQNRPNARHGL